MNFIILELTQGTSELVGGGGGVMAKLANCEPINIKSVIHMQLDPTYV